MAGRGTVPELVRAETAGFRTAFGLGLLLTTLAIMFLPAAIGILILLGAVG